jgi:hypothetical protein
MRTALISPLQVFLLLIKNEVHNEQLTHLGAETYELQPLVYSSLIQAGLEKLVFSSGTQLPPDVPLHVTSRIQREDMSSYQNCINLASSIFAAEKTDLDGQVPKNNLPFLWGFIGEVLYALRTRRPIVTFFDIPEASSAQPFLPPELSIPITNLLRHLTETTVSTGTPAVAASVHDIALCEEILGDEIYRSYAAKHSALERTEDRLDLLGKAIETDVLAMTSRHRQLRIEKVGISTLKLSSKFIDKVLLGLPGKLGEELAAAATEYLEDRQRIVIYKFMDIPHKIFSARMSYEMSSKDKIFARDKTFPKLAMQGTLHSLQQPVNPISKKPHR